MQTIVRLIKHEESYEVRVSTFIYFDENEGRRAITGRLSPEAAEEQAKQLARAEQAQRSDQK
ncbi:hypothetical protein ACQR1I_35995 [Bradyrhizobium sp. HKCCYLS2038]|uniref:hypothetical protein n=1 Tax=Bradyrhizobium sp. HKCCYLS2038 TaxID=3420764 RepID=UPI003EC0971E